MGFQDPLVVRREENEARAEAVPPPPKVVTERPRAPVGEHLASWWLISIRADFLLFLTFNRVARFPRICVRACTKVEIGLYCTVSYDVYKVFFFRQPFLLYHHFGN
jgi:hypothetical protein